MGKEKGENREGSGKSTGYFQYVCSVTEVDRLAIDTETVSAVRSRMERPMRIISQCSKYMIEVMY